MKPEVREALRAMAAQPGIRGCALVDLATGMVLHGEGAPELVPIAEAASDYWRLCSRQEGVFGVLGAPRAQVVIHALGRVTIVRCGDGLLLVTLSREPEAVDWHRWKRAAQALGPLAAGL